MAFVVSEGALRSIHRAVPPPPYRVRIADDYTADYAEIWRTQREVRTVIDFLARNVASLAVHTFRRVSDTDRVRLVDHPMSALMSAPTPVTTPYRFTDALMHDLCIYDMYFAIKASWGSRPSLVRVPPEMVAPEGDDWLHAEKYVVQGSRGKREFRPDQVFHIHGYNPNDNRSGSSPIESLRRMLAEEYEAEKLRRYTFRNGARVSGYIERPAQAPKWSQKAKDRFKAGWQQQYTGDGSQIGGTPVLEDGMVFKEASQTAKDLQYLESRKLTREEVAAAYHVPPPMVGILEDATFSNIVQQHKMLYQDTFGPWLQQIEQEFNLQVLPDLPDSQSVYVEFNLAEKLRGSFEEQADAMQKAVGGPVMTRNEGRSRLNLPSIDGADELIVPLNVLIGGQASPADSVPKSYTAEHTELLREFLMRQQSAVKAAAGAGRAWWDGARWDRELADDLAALAEKHLGVADRAECAAAAHEMNEAAKRQYAAALGAPAPQPALER